MAFLQRFSGGKTHSAGGSCGKGGGFVRLGIGQVGGFVRVSNHIKQLVVDFVPVAGDELLLPMAGHAAVGPAALRQLVGCGRGITGVTPARVVARGVGGFTLACPDTAPGNVVLDAGGRYAGVVTRTDGDTCTVEFSAAAGLCGSYAGLVTPGQWVLTGLPADCTLAAGDIVTTAGGDWLGTLAAPAPDADGLTAQVPLTDTADLWGTVYFVKK